jgi:aromatic ring-opening dioxygenase LigB subunit
LIAEMSQRVQDTITMIVTSLHANQRGDEITVAAADILCSDLTRKITGRRPSDSYYKRCSKLADMIIERGLDKWENIKTAEIMFPYKK